MNKEEKKENFDVNLDFKNETFYSFISVPYDSMNFAL